MIQINLIPDLKAEFLKAQSTKRVVIMLSVIVSAAFLALVILMWSYVVIFQGAHTSNLEGDVKNLLTEFRAPEDASQVLTVNKQLIQLPVLHDEKPDLTRLPSYLVKIIPEATSLDNISIDFEDGDIALKGLADEPRDIDLIIAVFKNAVYFELSDDPDEELKAQPVFQNTTLVRTGLTEDGEDTFELATVIDVSIFSSSKNIVLTVPNTSTDEVEFISPEELADINDQSDERSEDLFTPIGEDAP